MSYNQPQPQDQSLKREDQLTDVSKLPDIKADQSLGQRERVKQGGMIHTEEEEFHGSQGSTMHSLDRLDAHDRTSPEKVSSIHEGIAPGSLQHDATEVLHKGWEKASDTIAQGVEVVKRIIMSELPPEEGSGLPQGDLKEKAQDLSNKASEKLDEAKEKIASNLGDMKESAKDSSSQLAEKNKETKDQFKQEGQELKGQAQDFPSQSGSTPEWQPTEQMKQKATEKLGEYKERLNQKAPEFHSSQESQYQPSGRLSNRLSEMKDKAQGQFQESKQELKSSMNQSSQQSSSKGESESFVKIEKGQEARSSTEKINEIEDLSQQLNQKVEELKKTAHIPSGGATETIIIIQQGGEQAASTQESQFSQGSQNLSGKISEKAQDLKEGFKQSFQPSGSQQSQEQEHPKLGKRDEQQWRLQQQSQEQQRPKLGKRDEQQWRLQQQSGPSMTEKISDKAQDLKEGVKQSFQPSGSQQSQEFSGQEQQRPKLGKRDEQQWRYQQEQSGPTMSDQISNKAQELKEGFKQGFEKGLGHPSSQSQGLGDKIKQKTGEIKESYKENLQQSHEGHPHHESEHHLTTESKSFRPTPESKHLVEEQLLHKGGESSQNQGKQQSQPSQPSQPSSKSGSTSFKPVAEAKNLVKKATDKMEGLTEQATTSFNERLQSKGEEKPSEEKPSETHDEFGNLRTGPPPAEMVETITYHPRDIRGYEIEYVPKDEAEHKQSESKPESQGQQKQPRKGSQHKESQSGPKEVLTEKIQQGVQEARGTIENLKGSLKGEKETVQSQPVPQEERVPLVDRIQHGIEGVAHTIQTIKGLFKGGHESAPQGSTEHPSETHDEFGNLRTGPPPAEMVENITYHPRDIRGYEIEYVPKDHHEEQPAKSQSQSQPSKGQAQPEESDQHHFEYRRGNYLVEYTEKTHHEGESQQKSQEAKKELSGKASELSNVISQQAETLKDKFSSLGGKSEAKEQKKEGEKALSGKTSELSNIISQQAETLKDKYSALGSKSEAKEQKKEGEKALPEKASELSNIISQQAETLKDKYSSLGEKGKSEEKSEEPSKESQSEEKQAGFVSRILGKFTHGKEELQQTATENVKGASQDLSQKAEAAKEKVLPASEEGQSEEKQAGFVSRILGKFTHGKGESTEETSTEQNQSLLEKVQGKFQGKEKGEEVDKQGFRKVHDGFSETVDELKHERNQEFIEQIHVASENPFEPLATKQAQTVVAPTSNVDIVGGDLKNITSDFKEEDQEMVDLRGEDESQEKGKGFMQKMKTGLLSKFGRDNKENVESSDK